MEASPCPPMAALAAQYKTNNYIFETWSSTSYDLVLAANPMRWYVEFQFSGGAISQFFLVPGPIPNGFLNYQGTRTVAQYKFNDCPSIVTGEFYALSQMPAVLIITECVFLR